MGRDPAGADEQGDSNGGSLSGLHCGLWQQLHRRLAVESSDSKRDSGDKLPAEAVVQTFQNFLPAIADDFAQPYVAVNGDEESSVVQSGWLRVCHDIPIEQMVPNLDDFGFRAAAVHAEVFQHCRENAADGAGPERFGFFERSDIDAAPLAENALTRRPFTGTERRTGPIREREHWRES